MSASVFKPICHEMPRLRTQTPIDRGSIGKNFPSVKRVLFGPPDHEETRRILDADIQRQRLNASMKWNFDFVREVTLNPEGRYVWSSVTPSLERCKRPAKRSPFDEEDNLHLYCDPVESLRNANEEGNSESMSVSPATTQTRQLLITGMNLMLINASLKPTELPTFVALIYHAKYFIFYNYKSCQSDGSFVDKSKK